MLTYWAKQIEAEELPDVSETFDVAAVPYFVLVRVSTVLFCFGFGDGNKTADHGRITKF